jgi:hypothetical protein
MIVNMMRILVKGRAGFIGSHDVTFKSKARALESRSAIYIKPSR